MANRWEASMIWRMLFRSVVSNAWSFARLRAGKSSPARIAMMAMTTKSSIRVKAMVLRAGDQVVGIMDVENIVIASALSTAGKILLQGSGCADAHVRQEWQAPTIFQQRGEFQSGLDQPFSVACVGDDFAMKINDDGAAIVNVLRVASRAVHADHISLVLNGAGLEQPHPMMNPTRLPVGNHREQVRLMRGSRLAKDFREPQVVADERGNRPVAPGEHDRVLARAVVRGFAAKRERPHLRVKCQQLAGRGKYQRLVSRPAIASAHGGACDEADAKLPGRAR